VVNNASAIDLSGTANFSIDEEVLREEGASDYSQYLHGETSEADLPLDLFLD